MYDLPIFFSVFQWLCLSYILNSNLGSIQQPFSAVFHSVMLRFSVPISISFFVCPVPASNLCAFHLVQCVYSASLHVFDPVSLFNRNCIYFLIRVFFKCHFTVHVILSPCALTITAFVISAPFSSLGPISCFSIFLYFLFVWIMSRSILRCVD